jgi:glycerophosphoryl diester phosphodiesterase
MRPRPASLLALLLLLAVPATALAAVKKPRIQAHRGGSVLLGKPTYPENTLPAFKHAAKIGAVVEFDVKLTKDKVPIVIHDDTLDRTTPCTGPVKNRTYAYIAKHCRSDVLGSPGGALKSVKIKSRKKRVALSKLSTVLAALKKRNASISMEIKDVPGDDDFDPTSAYANRIMTTLLRAKFPKRHVIIQSFFAPNLTTARERWPGVATSMLTLKGSQSAATALGQSVKATWLSPEFPIDKAFVADAHAKGFKVVPYTLDTKAQVRKAKAAGVDALITDDPFMALKALGRRIPR